MNRSLEGVRGAAALCAVLFHMHFAMPALAATRNGYLCVDLFFVLSGFVIACSYGARLTNAPELRAFIVRRLGRLWPTLIAANVIYYAFVNLLLAALMLGHVPGIAFAFPNVRELLGIVTLTQGLHLFTKDIGVFVAWSASDELWVYVLFAVACLTLGGRARIAAFAAFALLGYALTVWASFATGSCARVGCMNMTYDYGWSRCLAGFFVGVLIAEFRAPLAWVTRHQLIALACTFAVLGFAERSPVIEFAAPVVFALLVASLARDSGRVARVFQVRPMQYLGSLSYSLYLGHAVFWPMLTAASHATSSMRAHAIEGALFLIASFALAHVLHRYVETPWRARFAQWSVQEPSIAAAPCKS